nr:uncharacterized protein LOC128694648 [Cherax quadricarinatus]XP_053640795.1 uncharacterized protein LOC128694648 [Cherax quadricarinatus]XP_053640796.1 uncharacterized protein LOC128694648 [Cherax quadricarinatus]XP_053640797.1 uncharacterized protein LOC128694648 [Cherax quadricarinatus]
MADECVVCGEAVEGKPLYKKLGSGEFNVEVITALHALQLTRIPESAKNDSYICWDCDEIIVGEYSRHLENEKTLKEEEAKIKQIKKQHRAQQRKKQLRQTHKKQKDLETRKRQNIWTVQQSETWPKSVKSKSTKLSKTKQLEQRRASNAHHSTHCVMCDNNFESGDRGYQRFPLKKRVNDEFDIAQVMEQLGLARHIEPKMKGIRFVCNPCFVIIRRNYKNKLMKGTSVEGSSSGTVPVAATSRNPIHRATTEEHAAEIAKLLPPALAECYKILTSDCMTKRLEDRTSKVESVPQNNRNSNECDPNRIMHDDSNSEQKVLSVNEPEGYMDDNGVETEAEDEDGGLNVSQDEHGNYFIDMDAMSSQGSDDEAVARVDKNKELIEENLNETFDTPRKKKNVLLPKRSHHHLATNRNDNQRQVETLSPIKGEAKTPEKGKNSQNETTATAEELTHTGICNICGISFTGKPEDWWYMLTSPLSGFESITVSMALKLLETSLAHSNKEACDARQVCFPCYGKVSAGFRSQVIQRIARQKNINVSQVNLSKVKVRMVPKEDLKSVYENIPSDTEKTEDTQVVSCETKNEETGEFEKENVKISDKKGRKRKCSDADEMKRKRKIIKTCKRKLNKTIQVNNEDEDEELVWAKKERSMCQKAVYVTRSRRKIKLSKKIADADDDDEDYGDSFSVIDNVKAKSRQYLPEDTCQNRITTRQRSRSCLRDDNMWNDSGGDGPTLGNSPKKLRASIGTRGRKPNKTPQKSTKPKAVVVLQDLKFLLPHEAFGGKAVSAETIEENIYEQVDSFSHSVPDKTQNWTKSNCHPSLGQPDPSAYSSPLHFIFNSLSNSLQPGYLHSNSTYNCAPETELNVENSNSTESDSCINGRCVVCGCNYSVQRKFWHNIDENIKPPTLIVPLRWVCLSLSVSPVQLSQRDRDEGKVCKHCCVRLAKQFEKFVKTKIGESCGMLPKEVDLSEYLITFNRNTMNIEADPKQLAELREPEEAGKLLMKILPVIQSFSIDDVVGKSHRQPLDVKDFSIWLLLVLNDLRVQTGAGIGDLAEWLIRLMPTEMYNKGLRPCQSNLATFILSVTKSSNVFTEDRLNSVIPPGVFILDTKTQDEINVGITTEKDMQQHNKDDASDRMENDSSDRAEASWEEYLTSVNIDELMKGKAKPLSVKQFNNGVLYALWRVSRMLGEDDRAVVDWLGQLSPYPMQKEELEKVVTSAGPLHNHLEKHPEDMYKLKEINSLGKPGPEKNSLKRRCWSWKRPLTLSDNTVTVNRKKNLSQNQALTTSVSFSSEQGYNEESTTDITGAVSENSSLCASSDESTSLKVTKALDSLLHLPKVSKNSEFETNCNEDIENRIEKKCGQVKREEAIVTYGRDFEDKLHNRSRRQMFKRKRLTRSVDNVKSQYKKIITMKNEEQKQLQAKLSQQVDLNVNNPVIDDNMKNESHQISNMLVIKMQELERELDEMKKRNQELIEDNRMLVSVCLDNRQDAMLNQSESTSRDKNTVDLLAASHMSKISSTPHTSSEATPSSSGLTTCNSSEKHPHQKFIYKKKGNMFKKKCVNRLENKIKLRRQRDKAHLLKTRANITSACKDLENKLLKERISPSLADKSTRNEKITSSSDEEKESRQDEETVACTNKEDTRKGSEKIISSSDVEEKSKGNEKIALSPNKETKSRGDEETVVHADKEDKKGNEKIISSSDEEEKSKGNEKIVTSTNKEDRSKENEKIVTPVNKEDKNKDEKTVASVNKDHSKGDEVLLVASVNKDHSKGDEVLVASVNKDGKNKGSSKDEKMVASVNKEDKGNEKIIASVNKNDKVKGNEKMVKDLNKEDKSKGNGVALTTNKEKSKGNEKTASSTNKEEKSKGNENIVLTTNREKRKESEKAASDTDKEEKSKGNENIALTTNKEKSKGCEKTALTTNKEKSKDSERTVLTTNKEKCKSRERTVLATNKEDKSAGNERTASSTSTEPTYVLPKSLPDATTKMAPEDTVNECQDSEHGKKICKHIANEKSRKLNEKQQKSSSTKKIQPKVLVSENSPVPFLKTFSTDLAQPVNAPSKAVSTHKVMQKVTKSQTGFKSEVGKTEISAVAQSDKNKAVEKVRGSTEKKTKPRFEDLMNYDAGALIPP